MSFESRAESVVAGAEACDGKTCWTKGPREVKRSRDDVLKTTWCHEGVFRNLTLCDNNGGFYDDEATCVAGNIEKKKDHFLCFLCAHFRPKHMIAQPCGHDFCTECMAKFYHLQCPICSEQIERAVYLIERNIQADVTASKYDIPFDPSLSGLELVQFFNKHGIAGINGAAPILTTNDLLGLKNVTLQQKYLTELPPSFALLKRAQRIYLFQNALTELPENFGDLQSLKTMHVQSNSLQSLPDSFARLERLRELNLSSNNFSALPEPLKKIYGLRDLTINANINIRGLYPDDGLDLAKKPPFFQRLQMLSMTDGGLTHLPDWLGRLQLLRILMLNGNKLSSLPATFGTFEKPGLTGQMELFGLGELQILSLAKNEFKGAMPPSICKLATLTILDLSHNKLTSLPDTIGDLRLLEQLLVDDNLLESIPEPVCGLRTLEVLLLSDNKIKYLPEGAWQMEKLKILEMEGNLLESLPQTFQHFHQLELLNLNKNNFKKFPELLCNLKKLKKLGLSYSKLTSLPDFCANMTQWKYLDLSHNSDLTHLPNMLGVTSPSLTLRLDGHQISNLDLGPVTGGHIKIVKRK